MRSPALGVDLQRLQQIALPRQSLLGPGEKARPALAFLEPASKLGNGLHAARLFLESGKARKALRVDQIEQTELGLHALVLGGGREQKETFRTPAQMLHDFPLGAGIVLRPLQMVS